MTCFDLTGESTCTVPLPVAASGDIFPFGDGTLVVLNLGYRDGDQELHVMRVDPRSELADVIFHEYPLHVAGYPSVATNIGLTWDSASRTAWTSLPEADWPPVPDLPDPMRFQFTDALHLDPEGVTRGPTVQRPALRPDAAMTQPSSFRLLDGNSWVTVYDAPAPYYDAIGMEATETGVMWMLIAFGDTNGGPGITEVVRWQPGAPYFEAFPIELRLGDQSTRLLAALDDETVAVLDVNLANPGSRLRAFTFPAVAEP